jgi:two-component system alkaline phosphatase synthesis response regulator PhoP
LNTVFCVEDDSNIRELIEYTLASTGFDVECFASGMDFFERLNNKKPDAVLLDIMLPDMDGMEILKKLRSDEDKDDIFVIMLTAKSERMDKLKGLDMGADDYITKPFDVLELISRIKAILRRNKKQVANEDKLSAGEISLDIKSRIVSVGGEEIALTYKEYELLHMLVAAKGSVVSREEIIGRIWGTDFEGESRTLDVHMRTLRQKLGDAGSIIDTVRNVGYKIS